MSCENFKTTLNGVEYNYTQLPASKSLNLKLRLTKVFGSTIPLLLEGIGKNDEAQTLIFTDAILKILTENNADEISTLITDTVSTVQVGQDRIDVDNQFSGDLVGLYTLFYWVIKKEYESFLAGVTGLLGDIKKPVKKTQLKSISPT